MRLISSRRDELWSARRCKMKSAFWRLFFWTLSSEQHVRIFQITVDPNWPSCLSFQASWWARLQSSEEKRQRSSSCRLLPPNIAQAAWVLWGTGGGRTLPSANSWCIIPLLSPRLKMWKPRLWNDLFVLSPSCKTASVATWLWRSGTYTHSRLVFSWAPSADSGGHRRTIGKTSHLSASRFRPEGRMSGAILRSERRVAQSNASNFYGKRKSWDQEEDRKGKSLRFCNLRTTQKVCAIWPSKKRLLRERNCCFISTRGERKKRTRLGLGKRWREVKLDETDTGLANEKLIE